MTKKKEYKNINKNGTPRILDKEWLDAEFKRMNGIKEKKTFSGWAVI